MSFDFAATTVEPSFPMSLAELTVATPLALPAPPVLPVLPPSARTPALKPEPVVISVGELDRRLKRLIEGDTAGVHVEGEVSGLREVASGHMYFTLKDEQ